MDDIKTLLIKREKVNQELEKIKSPEYIEKKALEIYGKDFTCKIVDNAKMVLSDILKGV